MNIPNPFRLNGDPLKGWQQALAYVFWIAVLVAAYELWRPEVAPTVLDGLASLKKLAGYQTFFHDYFASFKLVTVGLGLAAVTSLLLSYTFVIPLMRPLLKLTTVARFVSVVTLTYFVRLQFHSGSSIKLFLMTFAITVFFTTAMLEVVRTIPESRFRYARTCRQSELQIIWEVVVVEQFHLFVSALRQNNAIGFASLAGVEMVSRAGGLGEQIALAKKYVDAGTQLGLLLLIMLTGFLIDMLLYLAEQYVTPHLKKRSSR